MGFSETEDDIAREAVAAIEELCAAFGPRLFLSALLCSSAAASLPSDPEKTRRVTQYVLRQIVFARHPQLEAEVMAIGAGVLDERGIVTKIAAKHGMGRAAISRRAVAFCTEWKLPPGPAMKSEAARETYSLRNRPKS